jgi:hypothetical protein
MSGQGRQSARTGSATTADVGRVVKNWQKGWDGFAKHSEMLGSQN